MISGDVFSKLRLMPGEEDVTIIIYMISTRTAIVTRENVIRPRALKVLRHTYSEGNVKEETTCER
jgi:hypothetical protein